MQINCSTISQGLKIRINTELKLLRAQDNINSIKTKIELLNFELKVFNSFQKR